MHATVKGLLWVCRGASGQQKPAGGRSAETTVSLIQLVWPLSKSWVQQRLASPLAPTFQRLSLPAQVEALLISTSSASAHRSPSPACLQAAFGFSSDTEAGCSKGHPCGRASFSLFHPTNSPVSAGARMGVLPAPNSAKQRDERYCFSGGIASKMVHLQSKCCLECI